MFGVVVEGGTRRGRRNFSNSVDKSGNLLGCFFCFLLEEGMRISRKFDHGKYRVKYFFDSFRGTDKFLGIIIFSIIGFFG